MEQNQKIETRNNIIKLLLEDWKDQAPQDLSIEKIAEFTKEYFNLAVNYNDEQAKAIAGKYEDFYIFASDVLCKTNLLHL